jgi:long-subunit acyl-CoA synthetase (AMP-forming)
MSVLFDCITRHASQWGNKIAIAGCGRTITYGELPAVIDHAALTLRGILPAFGPVAWILDNGPGATILDLALASLGRPSLPLPPFFTATQREHALRQTAATALLTAPHKGQAFHTELCGQSIKICTLEPTGPTHLPPGCIKITFTSGSTGSPKGVCLAQQTIEETAQALLTRIGTEHAGIHCPLLPLSVLLENVAGLYTVLMAGGIYHIEPLADLGLTSLFKPDFSRIIDVMADIHATSTILVPELLRGIVAALLQSDRRLRELSFVAVGGATVSSWLLAEAESLGLPVFEGYGLSEAASVVSLNTPKLRRAGTAGRLLPHIRAHVAHDGELIVEHPLFLAYADGSSRPDPYPTGDIVSCDTEGYITVIGRRSNIEITSYGRNISPEWIERELLAHPAISQAMVWGDGQAALSALLVPESRVSTPRDLEAIVDAANARLPDYARVRFWKAVAPFTTANGQLTANGRLQRANIREAHMPSLKTICTEKIT